MLGFLAYIIEDCIVPLLGIVAGWKFVTMFFLKSVLCCFALEPALARPGPFGFYKLYCY